MNKRLLLGAALTALAVATGAAAQTPPLDETLATCAADNSACIVQVGADNSATIAMNGATRSRAVVHVEGSRNGRGVIDGQSRTLNNYDAAKDTRGFGKDFEEDAHDDDDLWDAEGDRSAFRSLFGIPVYDRTLDGEAATPGSTTMGLPALESGIVRQEGDRNSALVVVRGNDNDFHVTQNGDDNTAAQLILGNNNAVATVQGTAGSASSNNTAVQVQAGAGNLSYVQQNGGGNTALTGQVGLGAASIPELLTLGLAEVTSGRANSFAGGFSNEILLKQNGSAEATLLQVGSGHSIALQQVAGATAGVTQIGSGQQVAINQTGTTPVTVTQFGFR